MTADTPSNRVDATSTPKPAPKRTGASPRAGGPLSTARSTDIQLVQQKAFAGLPEYEQYHVNVPRAPDDPLNEYLFLTHRDPHEPDDVFHRLAWGGQVVFVDSSRRRVATLAERFAPDAGFVLEQGLTTIRKPFLGMPLPLLGRKLHYFTARKVQLIQPGDTTDRFTYSVQLTKIAPLGDRYVVLKQVPTYENVTWRLKQRFPDVDDDVIQARAHKLVDHVFPVFLTREAAILNILQRDLPQAYRKRVPKVLTCEKDSKGFVRRLFLNWLRIGGEPLSQLEFAKQSADLLQKVHDTAGVIHLDLRLDNMVITPDGVGFVDFGSAVRVGENLKQSRMLTSLFEEMMRTSEIQRMLGRMKDSGKVTSNEISIAHHKIDKAVDFFYLAVQFNKPHRNPDLKGLIRYDPSSREARALSALTDQILRPKNPGDAPYKSAKDILRGLEAIERYLASKAA